MHDRKLHRAYRECAAGLAYGRRARTGLSVARGTRLEVSGMSTTHKIARITVHPVAYPEPTACNATRYLTFVRVEPAEGPVGWVQAIRQFPSSTRAAMGLLRSWAEDLIG